MKPTLVVNPATDTVFATFAQMLADHGAPTTEELERRLRAMYPDAAVHARLLVDERVLVWYVYRDGRWVDPRSAVMRPFPRMEDARLTGRPASN